MKVIYFTKTLTKNSNSGNLNLNRSQLSLSQRWIQTKNEMMSDQPGGALMGNREIRAPLVDLLWWAHWEQRTVASPPFRPPPHTLQSFSSSSVPSPSLELSLKHTTDYNYTDPFFRRHIRNTIYTDKMYNVD